MRALWMIVIPFLVAACTMGPSEIGENYYPGISVSAQNSLVSVSKNQVQSGKSIEISISLKDSAFNPFVSDLPVVQFVLSGGTSTGVLGPVTNHEDGSYSATYTGVDAGTPNTVHVLVDGLEIENSLPTLQVIPGDYSVSYSQLTISAGSVVSGSSVTATLKVYDKSNQPFTTGGLTVVFTNSGGTSNGTFGAVTDHNDGTYSAPFYGTTSGSATTIGATIEGHALTSTLPTVTVSPGAPASLAVVSGNHQTEAINSSLSDSLVAVVRDASNNAVPSVTVDWSANDGTLDSAQTTSNTSGQVSNGLTFASTAGNDTVTASVHGTAITTSFTETAIAGTASQLVFATEPGDGVEGVKLDPQPIVQVEDAHGNLVTLGTDATATISLSVASGSGSLSGTASLAASSGVAPFTNIAISTAGSYTLKASATLNGSPVSVTSSAFDVLDQTPPLAPSLVFSTSGSASMSSASLSVTLTASACIDTAKIMIKEGSTTPLATDSGWQSCSTGAGDLSFTLSSSTQGSHALTAWAIDAAGNVSISGTALTLTYDNVAPVLNQVSINGGATYTGTPLVTVSVTATDATSNVTAIRLKEADPVTHDCQSVYADDNWLAYATDGVSQNYSFTISSGDGDKYLCAWAKDSVGNISTIASPPTSDPGFASIQFSIGHPPQIASASVMNNTPGGNYGSTIFTSGDQLKISFTLTDAEGLANDPYSISYSTNNTTWYDVVTHQDISVASNVTWMGGLSGNPTSYSGNYTDFDAPTSGYFRIKVVAKDMAGNTSVAVLSDSLSTPGWNIYAGTADRGVGGTALTAAFYHGNNRTSYFAFNPLNNDLYVIDSGYGINKVDAKTGIVSTYIKHGATNLPSNGTLTASNAVDTNTLTIYFDHNGLLYLETGGGSDGSSSISAKVYQIDPATGASKLYAGGGSLVDDTATPSTVFISGASWGSAFDESNSFYFISDCDATVFTTTGAVNTVRLLKITQNADHSAGTVSVVAGDCSAANPSASGVDALTSPFAKMQYALGSIAVWNNGQAIYYALNGVATRKIINGKNYATTGVGSSTASLAYNSANGKLYVAAGSLKEITPNLSGAGGETATTYINNAGTGDCMADGIPATDTCLTAHSVTISPQGTVFVSEGPAGNSPRNYRVRYLDSDSKIQTFAGTLPFFGDGLDKSVIRGSISGIYFKQSTEANQTAFPSGLYFMESAGLLMGRIDATTGITTLMGGNQQGAGGHQAAGTAFDTEHSLSNSYVANGKPLAFDEDGLPWFRYGNAVESIDENLQFAGRQTDNHSYFEDAATGADPANYSLYVYGGNQGFALKHHGLFVIGDYSSTGHVRTPKLSYFDYDAHSVTQIMASTGSGANADVTTAQSLLSATISTACENGGACPLVYRSDEDRLYFGEGTKLRYITAPTSGSSTLITLFTQPAAKGISNFIFHPSHDRVFYLSSGGLYCHDISSGKSWCNDVLLGPPTGMPGISTGANQFTWLDDNHLLISTYNGYILQYTLPP